MLASPRFVDPAPAEVVPTLLDEGRYLCSERTMYPVQAIVASAVAFVAPAYGQGKTLGYILSEVGSSSGPVSGATVTA